MNSQELIDDYDLKVRENYLSKIRGTKASYRILTKYGIVTGGYPSEHWPHKDKSGYFQLKDISNSLFPQKPVFCKEVCWFVPYVNVQGLVSGIYHVYLRHGAIGRIYMPDDVDVQFHILEGSEFRQISSINPFNDELIGTLTANNEQIVSSYVGSIDLSDFPIDQSITAKVAVIQTSGYWKGNWLFEGALFVPATSLETAPYYIQLGKDSKTTNVPTAKEAKVKMYDATPVVVFERNNPNPEYAKEQMSNASDLLAQEFDEGRPVRPIDLFSLDSTFYEDLEHTKFYCASITRKGTQTGTFNVLTIVDEPCDDEIISLEKGYIGIADIQQTGDFMSEGYENGYFNWVPMQDDNGRIVKMVILSTALGKVSNSSKFSLPLPKLHWHGDVPDEERVISWRWYASMEGKQVPAVTIE